MSWVRDSITQGEIDALHKAASLAWTEQTRFPFVLASSPDSGQCYVTARWLVDRLGGKIGRKEGHYVWLSSNEDYYLDLTGNHSGKPAYDLNNDYDPCEIVDTPRAEVFSKRANRAFENLPELIKIGLDYMGDPYWAQERSPQHDLDREQYWHDEPGLETSHRERHQFVYANGEISVSDDDHEDLIRQVGLSADYRGPLALGFVDVSHGQATWRVESNIDMGAFERAAEDFSHHVGWRFSGVTALDNSEINPKFVRKKAETIPFLVHGEGELVLGRTSHSELAANVSSKVTPGVFRVVGKTATMIPVVTSAVPAAYEWATDNDLVLYGSETATMYDRGSENDDAFEQTPDEKNLRQLTEDPDGLFKDPVTGRLFPDWNEYQAFRKKQEGPAGENWGQPDAFPRLKPDATFPPGFTEHMPRIMPVARKEAARVDGFKGGPEDDRYFVSYHCGSPVGYVRLHEGRIANLHFAKEKDGWGDQLVAAVQKFTETGTSDLLSDTVPFIFDVGTYKIHVGQPGQRTNDIRGDFTQGGIVEGVYEPGGKMIVRSETRMPYSVYGLVNLWYHLYPELEVKGVEMRDEEGGTKKLATSYFLDSIRDRVFLEQKGPLSGTTIRGVRNWDHSGAVFDDSEVIGFFAFDDTDYCVGELYVEVESDGEATLPSNIEVDPESRRQGVASDLWQVAESVVGGIDPGDLTEDGEAWFPNKKVGRIATRANEDRLKDIGGYISSLVAADPAAFAAAQALREAGGEVYAVGGAIRDAVLGKDPKDIDLMVTRLSPDQVSATLAELDGRVDVTGKDFGVFRYKNGDGDVEIALPRKERSIGSGHQDFEVQADPSLSPEEDLWRRDFTANAMAVNLANGKLVDPYNGLRDTLNGTLRQVNPNALSEDPLRVMRALVSHARHGLQPTSDTRDQMGANAASLKHLPAERVQAELDKLMSSANPRAGIQLAQDTGVLQHVLPEVSQAFGYDQNNPHHEQELGNHLLSVLERVSEKSDDPDLRMAALLHDIGKPGSQWTDPETGSSHFYKKRLDDGSFIGHNHEELGADMASALLNRLRYPNDRNQRISDLVRHHMYSPFTSPKGARRFVNRVGDHADDLLTLRWGDQGGKSAYPTRSDEVFNLDNERKLLDEVRQQKVPTAVSQLAVNGNDLMQAGIPQGPEIGQTLEYLVQRVLDDPNLNERDTLLSLVS